MNEMELYEDVVRFLRARGYARVIPEAALCDMDGTLYDSMPNHARAWFRLMSEQGIDCTPEEFFMYEGRTGASTINLLFKRQFGHEVTPEQAQELYHKKTVYFQDEPPVSVMPGAQDLIGQFMKAGIMPVLVTGSGQNTLLNRLNADYPGAFADDKRVTSRSVKRGKPDPEPYLMALRMAGVPADRAIALENAPLGVKSAADAGVFTIAVATGPIPTEALREAGAAVVFNSMPECAESFQSLLRVLNSTKI